MIGDALIYRHIEGVSVKADFSADRKYRYRLEVTRTDGAGKGRAVCVIMQNPSYAGETIADRSVQFMEKIVFLGNRPEFAGVDRLIVVNLYGFIQTKGFVPGAEKNDPRNEAALEVAIGESDIVIMAWGSSRFLADRESFVRELRKRHPGKVLLQTKSHPSRGREEGFIQSYPL